MGGSTNSQLSSGKMVEEHKLIAIFYCQNTPYSGETERQRLEKKYQGSVRLFPLPCGGRFDAIHVLRALERFADAAYVITCPKGSCRYFEGNLRAYKRMMRTKDLIQSLGLERDRVDLYMREARGEEKLAAIVEKLLERASVLPLSPVFKYVDREM